MFGTLYLCIVLNVQCVCCSFLCNICSNLKSYCSRYCRVATINIQQERRLIIINILILIWILSSISFQTKQIWRRGQYQNERKSKIDSFTLCCCQACHMKVAQTDRTISKCYSWSNLEDLKSPLFRICGYKGDVRVTYHPSDLWPPPCPSLTSCEMFPGGVCVSCNYFQIWNLVR